MKTTILYTSLLTAALVGTTGAAQTATSSGSRPAIVVPGRPITPNGRVMPMTPQQQPNAVQSGQNVAQPGFNVQSSESFATNGAVGNNGLANTNAFGAMTNDNDFDDTNALAVLTNGGGSTNGNVVVRDQAVTPTDQRLLLSLVQGIESQLGITVPSQLPVHFLINNGAVTIVGTVPNTDQSQRVLARVQQTPGVLSVFNDLRVGNAMAPALPQNNSLIAGAPRDFAFSPSDRAALTGVEQAAAAQLGISGASTGQLPVHFSIENGVVGVTGRLATVQEKNALLTAVGRVQGIVRVVDNVSVANAGTTDANVNAVGQVQAPTPNGTLPPTSVNPSLSNSVFQNTATPTNSGF